MENYQIYTTYILQFVHTYAFRSYQDSKNAAQNYLIFFYFISWYTQSLHFVYWWVRKGWQEKELWVILAFFLCHHFQHKLLIQESNTNENGYNRAPWLLVCLWWNCLLPEFKVSFISNGKCFLELSVSLLTQTCI